MNPSSLQLARHSLILVWLWTAVVSLQQIDGLSLSLLQAQTLIPAALFPWVIWGGAITDLVLGVLMAWRPGRRVYLAALWMTLVMTVIGSVATPALWLHPLGPLSKNLPILALLWILAQESHA